MLAHVAARLRARRAQAAGEGEADGGAGGGIGSLVVGEDGETIVVDDNCSVSFVHVRAVESVLTW